MREIPILFKGPMVNSILAGTKTQTRRIVKPIREHHWEGLPGFEITHKLLETTNGLQARFDYRVKNVLLDLNDDVPEWRKCPFGKPGDHLYVRETWAVTNPHDNGAISKINMGPVWYRADGFLRTDPNSQAEQCFGKGRWRPSIHMPKWASRIWLEVTNIRVERLKDITTGNCIKEGIPTYFEGGNGVHNDFKTLWESTYGHASWKANPFVWVVEFRRIDKAKE